MICRKCGRELPEDARFCGACGAPVSFGAPAAEPAATQPPVPPVQSEEVPPPPPAGDPVPPSASTGNYSYNYGGQTPPPVAPQMMQTPPVAPPAPNLDAPMSTGQFLLQELICMIPVVNLVMLLIWSFSDGTNTNRKNWSRSRLILVGIGFVLTIIFLIILIAAFSAGYYPKGFYNYGRW